MASCSFTLAASVLGAREIGYWTTSDLIFDQRLGPKHPCTVSFEPFHSHPSPCGFHHPLRLASEIPRSQKGLERRAPRTP